MVGRLGMWRNAHKDVRVLKFSFTQKSGTLVLEVIRELNDIDAEFNTVYTVNLDGSVKLDNSFTLAPNLNFKDPNLQLPRLGMQTRVSGDLSSVEWYGRGPHETYWDRKTSGKIGIYRGAVADQFQRAIGWVTHG